MEHQSFAKRTHGRQRVRKIQARARYGHRRLKQISRTATLGGLFLSFFKIGLTGFGGGFAVLSQIRHIVVLERRWLGEHDFVEALALGQSLPGTSAGNAVTYIGYRLRGWRGAGASLSAFILPSMFMMIALAIFYDRFRALPNTEQLFHGFNSAVVALIAVTAWRMGKQTVSKPWQRILMILSCAAVVVFKATVVEVILLSGLVGIGIETFGEKQLSRLERIRGFASRRQQRIRNRLVRRRTKPHRFFGGYLTEAIAEERLRRMSEAQIAQTDEFDDDYESDDPLDEVESEEFEETEFDENGSTTKSSARAFFLIAIPGLAKLGLALSLAFIFLRIGAVTFGGGFVMIPEIEAEVVNSHHWLTHQEFADATALGQITPGPVLIMATFVRSRNSRRLVRHPLRFPAIVFDDDCGRYIFQTLSYEPADAGFPARSRASRCGSAGRSRLERRAIRHSFDHWSGNGRDHSADPAALPGKCVLGLDRGGRVSIFDGVGFVVSSSLQPISLNELRSTESSDSDWNRR